MTKDMCIKSNTLGHDHWSIQVNCGGVIWWRGGGGLGGVAKI